MDIICGFELSLFCVQLAIADGLRIGGRLPLNNQEKLAVRVPTYFRELDAINVNAWISSVFDKKSVSHRNQFVTQTYSEPNHFWGLRHGYRGKAWSQGRWQQRRFCAKLQHSHKNMVVNWSRSWFPRRSFSRQNGQRTGSIREIASFGRIGVGRGRRRPVGRSV